MLNIDQMSPKRVIKFHHIILFRYRRQGFSERKFTVTYIKTKNRQYLDLNRYTYNGEQNFYYVLRNLFPNREVKRDWQNGSPNKYNTGILWYYQYNIWFRAVLDEEKDLKTLQIIAEGKKDNFIKRKISVLDDGDQIDLTEVHLKFRDILDWLKEDEKKFKKQEKLFAKLQKLRRNAKVSPQDSKMFVDFEDVDSDKFELTFHFLTEWETATLIKFYQGLTSGKFTLYLKENDTPPE